MCLLGILGIQYLANMYYFTISNTFYGKASTNVTHDNLGLFPKSKYELIPVTQTAYQVAMILTTLIACDF